MTPAEQTQTQNRVFYLDVLRVIACLCVIMIHAGGSFVVENIGSADFWVGNFLDSLSRICIPLFVMISGALMLDEGYRYSAKKIRGHIVKMLIFFAFWSTLYCVWYEVIQPLRHSTPISAWGIVKALVTGPYHFWFVYMIIGLYLIVPLLRLWVKKENIRYVRYFLILSAIFCLIIPQIIGIGKNYSDVFLTVDRVIKDFHLDYIAGYTMYYVLGWYLNNVEIRHSKLIYILGVLGFAATFSGTYFFGSLFGKEDLMYDNLYFTVALQGVAVFALFKNLLGGKQKNSRVIRTVSKCSLGIYAVHIFILENLCAVLQHLNINSAILQIPIAVVVTFILSFLVSWLLGKIPFLRRVV